MHMGVKEMGKALAVREGYRQTQWVQTIRACRESGLSNRAYCQQNGISEKTYYYWLRKLRERMVQDEMAPQLIKLSNNPELATSTTALCLKFKGVELEIPQGTDPETLTMVLSAIKDL